MSAKNERKIQQPVIFFGTPRSGTSVISEIVMRHKDLGFPSQFQNKYIHNSNVNYLRFAFDNTLWRIHGQKKQLNNVSVINTFIFRPIEAYPMWEAITGDNISFGRGFLYRQIPEEADISRIRSYFNTMVTKQGKNRLAFKVTGPSRLHYLSALFPDARFIRIERDPVPTVNSLLKVGFWKDRGMHRLWWEGVYTEAEKQWAETHKSDPVQLTAFQVRKIEDITHKELAELPLEVLTIKYLDFVREPEAVISQILDFANLSRDPACFDYFKKNAIYNQNKAPNELFNQDDLSKIFAIFDKPA